MKWHHFKKMAELQGITDDTEIGWIDCCESYIKANFNSTSDPKYCTIASAGNSRLNDLFDVFKEVFRGVLYLHHSSLESRLMRQLKVNPIKATDDSLIDEAVRFYIIQKHTVGATIVYTLVGDIFNEF